MTLPRSKLEGVIGIDGREYPLPTLEQVAALFDHNEGLVAMKFLQGFDRLEMIPMAAPMSLLVERLSSAILKHSIVGNIYQTRHSEADPYVTVRVNKENQVWIWEVLRQAFDTKDLVYFPKEYSGNHQGSTKTDVINDGNLCAVPGWSVGLVESVPFMPHEGQGKENGGRKQLEIGSSPAEYLEALGGGEYQGETGRTLEDFITEFTSRLVMSNEVSNDVDDGNALWCLGQYLKVPYADTVPTGRWIRTVGRVRLDAHRSRNKECAKNWGAATTVRLSGL